MKALKAIAASKNFAKLSVSLAQDLNKGISEEAIEKKAAVVGILAKAAGLAGMNDVAAEAGARQAKLDSKLDEEYHNKVPPFKPTAYAGRKNAQANRVALMELFTGRNAPPASPPTWALTPCCKLTNRPNSSDFSIIFTFPAPIH